MKSSSNIPTNPMPGWIYYLNINEDFVYARVINRVRYSKNLAKLKKELEETYGVING